MNSKENHGKPTVEEIKQRMLDAIDRLEAQKEGYELARKQFERLGEQEEEANKRLRSAYLEAIEKCNEVTRRYIEAREKNMKLTRLQEGTIVLQIISLVLMWIRIIATM